MVTPSEQPDPSLTRAAENPVPSEGFAHTPLPARPIVPDLESPSSPEAAHTSEVSREYGIALRLIGALLRAHCRSSQEEIPPDLQPVDFVDRRLDDFFKAIEKAKAAVPLAALDIALSLATSIPLKAISGSPMGMPGDNIRSELFADPEFMIPVIIGVIPVMEECIFRVAPSAVHNYVTGQRDTLAVRTGIAAATLFALGHNFVDGQFDTTTIPLPQFIGGLVLWYALRKHGFSTAVLTHALVNFTSFFASTFAE